MYDPSSDDRALPPSSRRPSTVWFWLTAAVILAADLATKAVVKASIAIGGPEISVLGEFFRLRHIRNSGGLFGLFPGNAIYFAAVSVLAVGVILWVLYRSHHRERWQQVALGMVLGGALGNFHDRIRYQEVVDFLDVGFGAHRWPTFNIADSGVSVGVAILVVWLYVSERREEKEESPSVDEPSRAEAQATDRTS